MPGWAVWKPKTQQFSVGGIERRQPVGKDRHLVVPRKFCRQNECKVVGDNVDVEHREAGTVGLRRRYRPSRRYSTPGFGSQDSVMRGLQ
jgi:hypothetical protein